MPALGRFLSVCADLCRGVELKFGNWGWVGEGEWYGGFGENWRWNGLNKAPMVMCLAMDGDLYLCS